MKLEGDEFKWKYQRYVKDYLRIDSVDKNVGDT